MLGLFEHCPCKVHSMLQRSLCPFVDYISSSADKSVQLLLLDGQLVAELRRSVGSGQIFFDTLVFD